VEGFVRPVLVFGGGGGERFGQAVAVAEHGPAET
jgi:hypothetical protein